MMKRRTFLTVLTAAVGSLWSNHKPASASPSIKVFAVKGEIVTCVNGHLICDVAEDLTRDMRVRVAHFSNWRIAKPEPHTPIKPCPCGADYIRRMPRGRFNLHIGDGWRDPRAGMVSL